MHAKMVGLLIGAAAFACGAAAELGVENGDFEKSLDGWGWWSRTGAGRVDAAAESRHDGKLGARVFHDGERDWAFSNGTDISVKPGELYRATAWVRVERGTVELAFVAYGAGEWMAWDIGSGVAHSSGAWRKLTAAAEIPEGCDAVRLRFVGDEDTLAHIDSLTVEPWDLKKETRPKVAGFAKSRVNESMDRGLVARKLPDGRGYISWRLLEKDGARKEFHLTRRNGTVFEKLSKKPITGTTDFVDESLAELQDTSRVSYSLEDARGRVWGVADLLDGDYISFPLQGDYDFQKAGIADLDGDGKYEYILKQPNDNVDPYVKYWKKSPGTYAIEAYDDDGDFMWRYDLGWAIERGIWYSPYIVYDFNGDGRAEVALKTGEGDPRDEEGKVKSGPEYLTVLDGSTGQVMTQGPWPSRAGFVGERGYNYYSRNQLGVAYLDGKTPCLIALRGTYNVMKAEAYQLRGDKLELLWRWDNNGLPGKYQGQGAHWMHAADVDGDDRDELVLGSIVLDDNGGVLWCTGLGHPDHAYVGDLDPRRPGLEIYYGIEKRRDKHGMCMVDAATGEVLWGYPEKTRHVHSYGMCSDIDARHPGAESYSADTDAEKKAAWARLWSSSGEVISKEMPWGFGPRVVYWDADPQRELLKSRIWNYGEEEELARVKGKVIAVADVLGDWREEIITCLDGEMRIYLTDVPAKDRRVCLMQDRLYRMDAAMGTMGYYQVPMLSYDMASGGE